MAGTAAGEYALYLRKSVGRAGIARQRTVTTGHIERLGGKIIAEFRDEDRTAFRRVGAARPDRPGFDRLLAYIGAHPGTGVAAWHVDRVTRDGEDTELVIRVAARGGHPVETPGGGTYDLTTATGRKRLRDDSTTATYEVDHMIERITAAKLESVIAGDDLGGRRRFGWRVEHVQLPGEEKPSRTFHLVPAEAKAIRDGTQWVTAGMTLAGVARRWNTAGLTTTAGNQWNARGAGKVLRRARNAGLLVHRGQVAGPGNWPPIVLEDDWRRCVAVLDDPARKTTPGNARRWLGSGLYECGVCGATVVCTQVGTERGQPGRPVYRCAPHRNHVARDARALDAYIGALAVAWLTRYGPAALIPAGLGEEAGQVRAEITAIGAQLRALAEHHGAGDIDAQQLVIASRGLRARLAPLEDREREIAAAAAVPSISETGEWEQGWATADLATRQATIRLLMTVTVLPAPRGQPPGHARGGSYFRPEYIQIDWREPF